MARKEEMVELRKSRQQIYRLINLYYSEGEYGFIHKNRGKKNKNRKSAELINKLENLYLKECYDYNFEQFYEEEVFGKYDISYHVMLKKFTCDDIISPLAHKKTVKTYNEKMKSIINDNANEGEKVKLELFKSRIIEVEKAHVRKSSNLYVFWSGVQMDACEKL